MLTRTAENTFSVRWVGGWLEIWGVKLISTQVVVKVELGNIHKIFGQCIDLSLVCKCEL